MPTNARSQPIPTLASLGGLALSPEHQAMLDACQTRNAGPAEWRHRKLAEAKDLMRLAQISGRLDLCEMDLRSDLRARVAMRVTVPCLTDPESDLAIAPAAHLGIVYREEAMHQSLPGYAFVQILEPANVWHPNVSRDAFQVVCLGASIEPGYPLRELILHTYMALTMIAIRLDTRDPAGLLNYPSCLWWTRHMDRLPLSEEPFIMAGGNRS